jgi:hypothetical protein
MEVLFTIRRTDALRALKEIKANRGKYTREDHVHLLVSEYAVTFRAVGTEADYPVNGITPGAAEVPFIALEKAISMRNTHEIQLRVVDGVIYCGKASVKHPGIRVGIIPDVSLSVPINASPFELLLIERILGKDAAVDQGLTSRLLQASTNLPMAIKRAATELAPYGISDEDIRLLIESKMKEAEPRVRAALVAQH